jgi:hypothetical protein
LVLTTALSLARAVAVGKLDPYLQLGDGDSGDRHQTPGGSSRRRARDEQRGFT